VTLGLITGFFGILPTMILGFITFPITLPIVLWKQFDQCGNAGSSFFACAYSYLPWADQYIFTVWG